MKVPFLNLQGLVKKTEVQTFRSLARLGVANKSPTLVGNSNIFFVSEPSRLEFLLIKVHRVISVNAGSNTKLLNSPYP